MNQSHRAFDVSRLSQRVIVQYFLCRTVSLQYSVCHAVSRVHDKWEWGTSQKEMRWQWKWPLNCKLTPIHGRDIRQDSIGQCPFHHDIHLYSLSYTQALACTHMHTRRHTPAHTHTRKTHTPLKSAFHLFLSMSLSLERARCLSLACTRVRALSLSISVAGALSLPPSFPTSSPFSLLRAHTCTLPLIFSRSLLFSPFLSLSRSDFLSRSFSLVFSPPSLVISSMQYA